MDFANLSMPSGGGDYIWRFGDGNSSTVANPSYTYAASVSFIMFNWLQFPATIGIECRLELMFFDKQSKFYSVRCMWMDKALNFLNS